MDQIQIDHESNKENQTEKTILKHTASTTSAPADASPEFKFSEQPSLERLRQIQAEFVRERDWEQFQTPRNLLLAMVNEVGELAEIFQWKGEVPPGLPDWNAREREHLGQELSDVFIYLMRLADVCRVDLPQVVAAKIEHNKKKYPADKFYGLNKKYNQE